MSRVRRASIRRAHASKCEGVRARASRRSSAIVPPMLRRSALAVFLAACSSTATGPAAKAPAHAPAAAPAPVATAPAPRPAPTPPAMRLPTTVEPVRNAVDLTLDPASEDFSGTITTALEIEAPTDVIWLNGDEITVTRATLSLGGTTRTATASYPKKGYLALSFETPLPAGTGTLTIAYTGKAHVDDGDGIYREKEAGAWYAFTQFESTVRAPAFPSVRRARLQGAVAADPRRARQAWSRCRTPRCVGAPGGPRAG